VKFVHDQKLNSNYYKKINSGNENCHTAHREMPAGTRQKK
jgi:hypothetical protein